jgi:hypothetical protein
MKYYIIHYTKNADRRARLAPHLEGDVEWIEVYDREDPIVEKIKNLTNSPLSLKDISCNLKHYAAMKKMVDEGVPEAVILEDDVVFFPEFKQARPFHASGLLRLGLGVGAAEPHRPPRSATRIYVTTNPGGSEATWITNKFAKVAIENANFDNTIDIIQYAILKNFFGEEMRCMNTCFQTSLDLTGVPNLNTDWKTFCENFRNYKQYSFTDLLEGAVVNHIHGQDHEGHAQILDP